MADTSANARLIDLCINSIRFLSIDAVERAKSGHPGAPMGCAAMAFALWDRHLVHNPRDTGWANRDRFILSNGHASLLLYSLLHLTGYDLPMDELMRFRQWGSKTPGHPEYGLTPGAETTTGPLGQGFANGVGMAYAEKWLAERYNRPGQAIIDHHTYAIVSDGDLQEGVVAEAASFAGAHRLGKIVYLYDDNGISIEGDVRVTFTEDVAMRFRAYGWHVVGPIDGLDVDEVDRALAAAKAETGQPSLIVCRTIIGYGSPNKANSGEAHGTALGEAEVALVRQQLGWEYEPFELPDEALTHFRKALSRGTEAQQAWEERFEAYKSVYPIEAAQLLRDLAGELPVDWSKGLSTLFEKDIEEGRSVSTRVASGRVMNAIAERVHGFVGGSGDLAPSTSTLINSRGNFGFEETNVNIPFGVREHAMGAIANGIALHGGILPYTATFLVFYDYMRPPVRLAALMGARVAFIYTHDSVGLGEDGPTHQPIEQLMGLRLVPGLVTLRPADARETAAAWQVALERLGPTALVLTRQNLPILGRLLGATAEDGVRRGAYVLWESSPEPQALIIGTGSEAHVALEAGQLAAERGLAVRVVSMPSWELFEGQPQAYKDAVLLPTITNRVSVEAGTTWGWERYVGQYGQSVGIDRFGASAPGAEVMRNLGITPEAVVRRLGLV